MITKELPVIHALWIGGRLGELSRCCLKSFLMRGHQVHLHAYDDIWDVPEGITVVDGNQVVPQNRIMRHEKTGSYALFSDLFRYQLLRHKPGIYVDCDVYCLRPLHIPESGFLFGLEEDKRINGAILAIPANSELLNNLTAAACDPSFIPPWYKKSKQRRLKIRKLLRVGRGLEKMPWGVIGPDAITHYVKELGLWFYARPIDVFYPIHYRCIRSLLDPDLNISEVTTSRTAGVHLYNEMLKDIDLNNLHSQCILQKFLRNEI